MFAVDPQTGAVRPVTGEGHVASMDVTPTGFVYAQDALDRPADLFISDGGAARRRTASLGEPVNPSNKSNPFLVERDILLKEIYSCRRPG